MENYPKTDRVPPPNSCNFFTNEFQVKYFLPVVENTKDYSTSWILRPRPVFIIYRFIWMVFWLETLVQTLVVWPQSGKYSRETFLTYLTNWGLLLNTLGSIVLFVCSVINLFAQADGGPATLLYKFASVLYTLYTPLSVYISLVYWASLDVHEHDGELTYLGFVVHTINILYTTFDLFISSFPFRILTFWYGIILAICYSMTTVIYWAAAGRGVYFFVNWTKNPAQATAVCVATVLSVIVFQFIVFCIFWLRNLVKFRFFRDRTEEDTNTESGLDEESAAGAVSLLEKQGEMKPDHSTPGKVNAEQSIREEMKLDHSTPGEMKVNYSIHGEMKSDHSEKSEFVSNL